MSQQPRGTHVRPARRELGQVSLILIGLLKDRQPFPICTGVDCPTRSKLHDAFRCTSRRTSMVVNTDLPEIGVTYVQRVLARVEDPPIRQPAKVGHWQVAGHNYRPAGPL